MINEIITAIENLGYIVYESTLDKYISSTYANDEVVCVYEDTSSYNQYGDHYSQYEIENKIKISAFVRHATDSIPNARVIRDAIISMLMSTPILQKNINIEGWDIQLEKEVGVCAYDINISWINYV